MEDVRDGANLVIGDRDRRSDLHLNNHRRKYLPTFAELVDRLSIVQLKEIFISDHRDEYRLEREMIEHDIDLILAERYASDPGFRLTAKAIHAISMIQLTNRYIWENESRARQGGDEQDKLLKLTHSINGVRNRAKNVLSAEIGERLDHKVDCFAESLVAEFGNWNVFDPVSAANGPVHLGYTARVHGERLVPKPNVRDRF